LRQNHPMPPKRANPKSYETARHLRKLPTPAEKKLWMALRGNKLKGLHFRRQHAIGKYIIDFICVKRKLAIELDGTQHLEQSDYDIQRTAYLESQGYKVIRFWNDQIMNDIEGVIRSIEAALIDE
jgi:very-short-patch-repair endonuclease